ncbi:MAG: ATP-binding protein [Nibricoccus sp.]
MLWLPKIEAWQSQVAAILTDNEAVPAVAFQRTTRAVCEMLNASRVGIWILGNDQVSLKCCDLYDSHTGVHYDDFEARNEAVQAFIAKLRAQNGVLIEQTEGALAAIVNPRNTRLPNPDSSLLASTNIGAPKTIFLSVTRVGSNHPWSEEEMTLVKPIVNFLPILFHAVEKREALAELKRNFSLLTGTLESTEEGIVATDLNRAITLANQRFMEMVGLPNTHYTTVVGKTIKELLQGAVVDPRRVLAEAEFLYEHLELQGTHRIEFVDGRLIERYSRPQRIEGKIVGRIFSYRDITAQVRGEKIRAKLEQELWQAQKLEAIGTLAGGIAHDFNNVLSGITCNLELIRGDLPDGHPALESISEIATATKRAADMVRQMLTFSRRTTAEMKPVDVGALVREALRFIRATIPKTIEFKVEIKDALPTILADATQLHQVLMNLCTNAWHAIGDRQGEIQLSVRTMSVERETALATADLTEGAYVLLSVRDSGRGMDESTLRHIFEPFFTTKEPGSGTGLGLSVVHGIVRTHGGAIRVTSVPDGGTCFELYFPVSLKSAPKETTSDDSAFRGNGEVILLLDDEPQLVSAGKKLLERLGFRVIACTDVNEALGTFERAPQFFHAVICDITMPIMNGFEFAMRLHALDSSIPIIAVTGNPAAVTAEASMQAGVREVLLKPLSLSVVSQALARVLR